MKNDQIQREKKIREINAYRQEEENRRLYGSLIFGNNQQQVPVAGQASSMEQLPYNEHRDMLVYFEQGESISFSNKESEKAVDDLLAKRLKNQKKLISKYESDKVDLMALTNGNPFLMAEWLRASSVAHSTSKGFTDVVDAMDRLLSCVSLEREAAAQDLKKSVQSYLSDHKKSPLTISGRQRVQMCRGILERVDTFSDEVNRQYEFRHDNKNRDDQAINKEKNQEENKEIKLEANQKKNKAESKRASKEFKALKKGEADTEERNLSEMSEETMELLRGMSMVDYEGASLWETMGKSFMKNKVRLMNSLWGGKDSTEMKAVKDALDKLSGFYQTGLGAYFKNIKMNPETGLADRASIEKAKEEALAAYNDLAEAVIVNAENYIKVKKPRTTSGKERLNNVKQLKEQLERDKDGFDGAIRLFAGHMAEKKIIEGEETDFNKIKFADVLRIAKAEEHDFSNAGGGGGNTFSFEDNNHKKKFFKINEKIANPSMIPEFLHSVIEKEANGAKPEDAAIYTKFLKALDRFDEHFKTVKKNIERGLGAEFLEKPISQIETDSKIRMSSKSEEIYHQGELLARYCALYRHRRILADVIFYDAKHARRSREDLDYIQNFLNKNTVVGFSDVIPTINLLQNKVRKSLNGKYHPVLFTSACSKVNGINDECVVTMRSVATSRMADEIAKRTGAETGVDEDYAEAVVGSKIALVKTENGYKSGIVMDGAKGIPAADLMNMARKKKKPFIFTAKAAKQYNFLMIFDYICGQGDRHGNNFMTDYKETPEGFVINSVQAIDNDYSFGELGVDKIKYGYNRLCPILDSKNDLSFKYMDKKLVDAIMNMDDSFIKLIKHQLADCQITDEQFAAMEERIVFLQEKIKESLENKKLQVIEKNEDWTGLTMGKIMPKTNIISSDPMVSCKKMSDYIYDLGAHDKKIK